MRRSALFGSPQFVTFAGMVNASQIARLLCRSLPWAWRRIDAGVYGAPSHRGGRDVWVPVAAVEQAEGVTFTDVQIAAAAVPASMMEMADAA
jgi:hypothetical protein